jgi:mono/diheme cytochrome c family protein
MTARVLAAGACIVLVSAAVGVSRWRSANIGAVQRGADLARVEGCVSCHEGAGASSLPRSFFDLDETDPATLREWILDGIPSRVRRDPESRAALTNAAIQMPSWRGRLSDANVGDLVAYLRAVAGDILPDDPLAQAGQDAGERLGCFRCHGPGGRGAGRNPGSLKGYIPPWDGADFAELVANDAELSEWILEGRPRRLQANPVARFFLDRQAIRMPAFRNRISDDDRRALESYIGWLRSREAVSKQ